MTKNQKNIIFAHAEQARRMYHLYDNDPDNQDRRNECLTECMTIDSLMFALNIADEFYFELSADDREAIRDHVWNKLYSGKGNK